MRKFAFFLSIIAFIAIISYTLINTNRIEENIDKTCLVCTIPDGTKSYYFNLRFTGVYDRINKRHSGTLAIGKTAFDACMIENNSIICYKNSERIVLGQAWADIGFSQVIIRISNKKVIEEIGNANNINFDSDQLLLGFPSQKTDDLILLFESLSGGKL